MLPFLSASSLLCICLTVLAVFFPSHWVSVYQGFPRAAHRVTFLACAPCLSSPFAPQICAWVRSVLGMAVLPCAWGHGVRPCLKPAWLLRSGHSTVSTSPPKTRGHRRRQFLGRTTPSTLQAVSSSTGTHRPCWRKCWP